MAAALGAFAVTACGQDRPDLTQAASPPSSTASPQPAAQTAQAQTGSASTTPAASRPRVVVLGDSLSAGLGLSPSEAYPSLLQRKIDAERLNFEIVNAGVSGDTTAGGVRRLDWSLDGDVRVLIVELGGNDGLRGLPVTEITRNLSTIIEAAKARHIAVLLCGIEAPPNFGASYTSEFHTAFKTLAEKHRVPFVPFLLVGVAGLPQLNQADGIHPNAEGARKVADTVWAALRPMLAVSSSATS
jgi:acyl-CoA thioesterase-1